MTAHVAIVYSPHYRVELGGLEQFHSFDVNKYARIHGQLEADGFLGAGSVVEPEEVSDDDIRLVHTELLLRSLESPQAIAEYLEAPVLSMVPASVLRRTVLRTFRRVTGGTVLAGRLAPGCGIAVNLGGGYHHAGPSSGGGFCIFNDIAVAVRRLRADGLFTRALIVDLDVHQGNGTARIFADDPDVFTFSMHQEELYPVPKATSDLDVGLDPGTDDVTYLDLLGKHLPGVLDGARAEVVFYQGGCDTMRDDPLADLMMTEAGIVERDATVVRASVERGLPVAMTLGGGYAPHAWHAQYASVRNLIQTYGLKE